MQNSILLLHGAIGAKDQLKELENYLIENKCNVFSFNFSGHGQTIFQNSFSIEQFAEELKSFIQKNNLIQPHIFGYSMGGYVACYVASQEPELLGNIITLGTKFAWSSEIAQQEIKMLDAKTIIEKVPKLAEALKIRHGNNWEELLSRTAEMMLRLGSDNILDKECLSKIKNKTLIGLADKDLMVSVEETDSVASQIKNSKQFTLENTKHPIETVDVNVLGKIIKEFSS